MLRTIKINAVLNGFVVDVGCQKLVYTSVDSLLQDLKDYLTNPKEVEARFIKDSINTKHTLASDNNLVAVSIPDTAEMRPLPPADAPWPAVESLG